MTPASPSRCGLERLPASAREQLARVVELFRSSLGASLLDVFLHGSAATSGFDPARSDLDLLVVVDERLTDEQRRRLAAVLLAVSENPHPVEVSVVALADLQRWRHPCPFEFHYSEAHRARFAQADEPPSVGLDEDLAAHLSVAKARGVALLGRLGVAALPIVPRRDYLRAILSDFAWAEREGLRAYATANACRTLAYLRSGQILSKTEGLAWCARHDIDASQALALALRELVGGDG